MPDGEIDTSITSPGRQVIAPNDANLVTYALQGVVREGTGTAAAISGYPVAGKTGTANENVDAWFCGYTVQVVTCVWMGWPEAEIPLEDIEGVSSVYGGTIPAEIWHNFMTVAMSGQAPEPFPVPSFDGYTLGPPVAVYLPPPSPSASPSPSPSASPSASPSPSAPPSASPTGTPSPSGSPSPSHLVEHATVPP
jgi:membrane peptidoglycan carboxypeptidase